MAGQALFDPLCAAAVAFMNKEELKDRLSALPCSRILFLASPSALKRWRLAPLIEAMRERAVVNVVTASANNPTPKDIREALLKFAGEPIDGIAALGGGSIIDLAKGVSAFYDPESIPDEAQIVEGVRRHSYRLRDSFLPIVAIPTTAGTGSELTQWGTIWDLDEKKKYSVDAPMLKPRAAYIVPELTLTLSPPVTLSTGLDALSHAVEAYWSKRTSPLVRALASQSIGMILGSLEPLLARPQDMKLREKLCCASVLAGLAFSQTRTTACHSLSYPLTMFFNVPHGLAAAMTLGAVARRNAGHFPDDAELFDLFAPYGGVQAWLDGVCAQFRPLRLSSFGVKADALEMLCDHAFTAGRMDNNPVAFSRDDALAILREVL